MNIEYDMNTALFLNIEQAFAFIIKTTYNKQVQKQDSFFHKTTYNK